MSLAVVFPKTVLRHDVWMLLSDCTCSLDLFIIFSVYKVYVLGQML